MGKELELNVGIDVAKDELDVSVRPLRERFVVSNDAAGHEELVARLSGRSIGRIVLEATGGYEVQAALALSQASLPVCIVSSRQVRDFKKSIGQLAKTDSIAADVLAHFAEAIRPEVKGLPDQTVSELSELVARRRQLVEMRTSEVNCLEKKPAAVIAKRVRSHVAWLEKEVRRLEGELDRRIKESPLLWNSIPCDRTVQ